MLLLNSCETFNIFLARLCSSISRSNKMNTNKLYFRHIKEEGKVDITFLLKTKGSLKQLNLSRQSSETIPSLSTRIAANVKKTLFKKQKNKQDIQDVRIEFYDGEKMQIPANLTCLDLFEVSSPVFLKIGDEEYETIFNSPWVVSLSLPQCILAGFYVYPESFQTNHTEEQFCSFNWYVGATKNEQGKEKLLNHVNWEMVCNNLKFMPKAEHVGLHIKLECIPGNEKKIGPLVETISKNPIEAGPGKCPFETRHKFTTTRLQNKSFRCVTYNILADLYCDSDYTRTVLFPYCPPYALQIEYRRQLIIKELLGYNADLLCLQEVDRKVFKGYLSSNLALQGLSGLFYKKGKEVAEGLALFYRKERFQVLDEEHIVLSEAVKSKSCLKNIWDSIKDNEPLCSRLLDRSTVASSTVLQFKQYPEELLLVGNTHLYFHPDADHIRLLQGGIAIYWLNDVLQKVKRENPGKRVTLILCGDFNSVPSNGVFQLYTTGTAPSTLPDWHSNVNEAVKDLSLLQPTILGSACGTPQFTNFTEGFADCLDYIFYEKSNIDVEQVIPLPSIEELKAHTALPSIVFPSDHVSLISDLKLR